GRIAALPQSTTLAGRCGVVPCQGSTREIRPGSDTWTAASARTRSGSGRMYLARWMVRIIAGYERSSLKGSAAAAIEMFGRMAAVRRRRSVIVGHRASGLQGDNRPMALFLTEADVGQLATMQMALDAVEEAFRFQGEAKADNAPRRRSRLQQG